VARTALHPLTAAAFGLALAACGGADDGLAAYREGRFEDAHRLLGAALRDAGPSAAPELAADAALAALRAGAAEDATAAAKDAIARGGPDLAGFAEFVRGNAAFAKCDLAEAQARLPESEPFAFDVAIRWANVAREAWIAAASSRGDWPEARRNVERANLRLEALTRAKADAEAQRRRPGPPKIRPKPLPSPGKDGKPAEPQPPQPSPGAQAGRDAKEPGGDEAVITELSPAEVRRLRERLAEKEREKVALRRAQQEKAHAEVERDW
jgi:hypothetical protein